MSKQREEQAFILRLKAEGRVTHYLTPAIRRLWRRGVIRLSWSEGFWMLVSKAGNRIEVSI